MSARLPVALALAAIVAGLLFWVMSALVAPERRELGSAPALRPIELVRPRAESEAERKERRRPPRPEPEPAPSPPPLRVARPERPPRERLDTSVVTLPPSALTAAPAPGAALSDMDVVPLVRIAPEYPRRAAQRGIGGWVLLEFSVSAAGTVSDVRVVDAEPPGTFERAAVQAVEKFKYRPKIENGKPVERTGIRIVMRFEPDPEAGPE